MEINKEESNQQEPTEPIKDAQTSEEIGSEIVEAPRAEQPSQIDESPIVNEPSPEKLKEYVESSSISDTTTQVETNDGVKIPKRKMIDVLFDFVRTDTELNPVLCGYFCKLINSLINSQRKNFNLFVFDS